MRTLQNVDSVLFSFLETDYDYYSGDMIFCIEK